MRKISLVVCLYKERDLLARLLKHADGCYDDLVVVHDGPEENAEKRDPETLKSKFGNQNPDIFYENDWKSPEDLSLKEPNAPPIELARDYADLPPDAPIPTGYRLVVGLPVTGSIHELVTKHAGRFYEGPRCYQQEPHWPFAWWAAKNDWILRLDADEYPTEDLRHWLTLFKDGPQTELPPGVMAIWPLWTGAKQVWCRREPSRLFLFDRSRVKFFGMVEHTPMPAHGAYASIPLLINHRPVRKSYGLANLIVRKQAYRWRYVIASSLLKYPQELPCWAFKEMRWPEFWEKTRSQPLKIGIRRGLLTPMVQALYESRHGAEFVPDAYIGSGLHQLLMGITYFLKRIGLI